MIIAAILLLVGLAWGLWNLYQQVLRLDDVIEQWEDTLATLRSIDDPETSADGPKLKISEGAAGLRIIVEITDAVGLAKRYHWAGGAGALAPSVLKKTMQKRVLKEVANNMDEGGHIADVKVIVL